MSYATEAEIQDHFSSVVAPFATYDFRVRDESDNGEFITSATVDLIERGLVVHTEQFVCSSEDAHGPTMSAYGNGRDNHASTQARSYAWAWVDSKLEPFEARFAPFGSAWQAEQADATREGCYA